MKTLSELNSKWYWRLVKVLYFIVILCLFILTSVLICDYFKWYNPKNIEIAETGIKSIWVLALPERMNKLLTEQEIKLTDLPKIITKEWLVINKEEQIADLLIVSESVGKKIDRVFVCGREYTLWCSQDGKNSVWSYIEDSIYNPKYTTTVITISNKLYSDTKERFERQQKIAKEAVKNIEELKSWKDNWNSFYDYTNLTGQDIDEILGNRNYLGIKDYFYIITSILWVFFILGSLSIWLQKITYYIILGTFKPKK